MAGFDNDVCYGTNVDFSGGSPVTGQMVANGQLLIGASVAPFIRANTLTAGTGIAITNGPGTIIITNTGGGGGGGGTNSLQGNSGSATQSGGVINVVGGTNITTSGSGQTLTINPTGSLLALANLPGTGYVVQTGANTFVNRSLVAGSGISLTNSDGVLGATTITADTNVPLSFAADSGSATPALNTINLLGTAAQGIMTSAAGSTVTFTADDATATQKGVAKFDVTNFTVTAGHVDSNPITVTAGTGLTTGGSVNLGGSVTLALDVPVTVPNGGTGRTALSAFGVLIGEGTAAVNVTNAATNGQVLIGATGADPAFASIAGTDGVTLTPGVNSLSIGLVNVPNSALANDSITVTGGSGISVTGSPVSLGGTVTISTTGTIATQFSTDSGTAVPSLGIITMAGDVSQGITSSGSGSTVTYTIQDATTALKGVASFNSSDFTVSSGAVSLNATGAGKTITGDTGGALSPTLNNWNILGQQAGTTAVMDTIGSVSTLKIENRAWLTPLVVDASATVGLRGTFTTITAALAAAVSGQTIFVRPGTYTENITLKAGVNLCAFICDAYTPNVIISGKCTFNTAGIVTITGIRLQTNSDFAIAVTGSDASVLNLVNCYIKALNNTAISFTSSSSSAQINILMCNGKVQTTGITLYTMTSAGSLFFDRSYFENNGSITNSTISSGSVFHQFTYSEVPVTTSGTAGYTATNSHMSTFAVDQIVLTAGGSGSHTCRHSTFKSFSTAVITITSNVTMHSCNIETNNTTPITGAGSITYSSLAFNTASSSISTTTQLTRSIGPRILLSGGCQILSGSGSPSGVVTAPKGSLFLRTDGSNANNRAFINTDGATAWAGITTV